MTAVARLAVVICKGDGTVGAVQDMAALLADEKGGETPAIDEEERLSPLIEIAFECRVHLR